MNIDHDYPPNRPITPNRSVHKTSNRPLRRLPQEHMGSPTQAAKMTQVVRQRALEISRPAAPSQARAAPPAEVAAPLDDFFIFSLDMQASPPPAVHPPRSPAAGAGGVQPAPQAWPSGSLMAAAQQISRRQLAQRTAQTSEAARQDGLQHEPLRRQLGFELR